MAAKRSFHDVEPDDADIREQRVAASLDDNAVASRPTKRVRQETAAPSPFADSDAIAITSATKPDYLSSLSDELLVRILSYLSEPTLVALSPVSRRLHRLSEDSHLWKPLYHRAFVQPRLLRKAATSNSSNSSNSNNSQSDDSDDPDDSDRSRRRAELDDGSHGGHRRIGYGQRTRLLRFSGGWKPVQEERVVSSWKQEYRLRHNWDRGECAVEELPLRDTDGSDSSASDHGPVVGQDEQKEGDSSTSDASKRSCMLVKLVDGLVVSAHQRWGLRVWEVKTRSLLASTPLLNEDLTLSDSSAPTSLDVHATEHGLDIALGRKDGGFDIWYFDSPCRTLQHRYSHKASNDGPLDAIAYAYPLVLTATKDTMLSCIRFLPKIAASLGTSLGTRTGARTATTGTTGTTTGTRTKSGYQHQSSSRRSNPPPQKPPMALSIDRLPNATIASVAYTFSSCRGWCIGLQEIHVSNTATADDDSNTPVITNRTAYAMPLIRIVHPSSHLPTDRPSKLCYTYPYLLIVLPDNTLILHLVSSSATALVISRGIRLWGHTSGIALADITSHGRAVSVSNQGDELRIWDLEDCMCEEHGGSVVIRPRQNGTSRKDTVSGGGGSSRLNKSGTSSLSERGDNDRVLETAGSATSDPKSRDADSDTGSHGDRDMSTSASATKTSTHTDEQRHHWVGFDDEMVLVLKESRGEGETLMVYDFT